MNRRAFLRSLAGAAISAASWCYAGPKLLVPALKSGVASYRIWIEPETPLEAWFRKVAQSPVNETVVAELMGGRRKSRRFMSYARDVAGDPPPVHHVSDA